MAFSLFVCIYFLSFSCPLFDIYFYVKLGMLDAERWTEQNHTLYLSFTTVKSYGTEDRHTDRPVPPKDEIYEYIIFRGSDIKDITVSEPPKPHHGLPRDPAIVQVCVAQGDLSDCLSTL